MWGLACVSEEAFMYKRDPSRCCKLVKSSLSIIRSKHASNHGAAWSRWWPKSRRHDGAIDVWQGRCSLSDLIRHKAPV